MFSFFKEWTTVITVVFILVMGVFNIVFSQYVNRSNFESTNEFLKASFRILDNALVEGSQNELAVAQSSGSVDFGLRGQQQETVFIVLDSAALLNTGNPLSNIVPTRDGLLLYKIQKGDNLSRIAANFGISLNTILWANENIQSRSLQPGQEIVILPVTGVLHRIQPEETIDAIANQYGVPVERILNANPQLVPSRISEQAMIIIPDSRPMRAAQLSAGINLPSLPGYFAIPTTGWNLGQLHNYNAVDIANACGTPVYAAAEGLVTEAAIGWNEGYGNYILIEHPNGTRTKYAHNEKNLVSIGDYVVKGDQIAIIGNTGNTHGPTGCHLHFEIKGARNPFVK